MIRELLTAIAVDLDDIKIPNAGAAIREAIDLGLVERTKTNRLRLTDLGWLLLREVQGPVPE